MASAMPQTTSAKRLSLLPYAVLEPQAERQRCLMSHSCKTREPTPYQQLAPAYPNPSRTLCELYPFVLKTLHNLHLIPR